MSRILLKIPKNTIICSTRLISTAIPLQVYHLQTFPIMQSVFQPSKHQCFLKILLKEKLHS
ncbi:hypothetical protein BpHYR1_043306 [Brachionus plicatilis]|uniref:Uncharacterized protein n=1 Tax=Brachionus plicatilis TaxID=10195 RepID=A0A3M7QIU8_BRAPC|nr:hypothetical protein BpHYR1_043306 [Brachionus plicatilis]